MIVPTARTLTAINVVSMLTLVVSEVATGPASRLTDPSQTIGHKNYHLDSNSPFRHSPGYLPHKAAHLGRRHRGLQQTGGGAPQQPQQHQHRRGCACPAYLEQFVTQEGRLSIATLSRVDDL